MTENCMFCEEKVKDLGLGWYAHVETHPTCDFLWSHWIDEIPHDHGGD